VKFIAGFHEFDDFGVILWQKLNDVIVILNIQGWFDEHSSGDQQDQQHRQGEFHGWRCDDQANAA
jgi:hypothetical protein